MKKQTILSLIVAVLSASTGHAATLCLEAEETHTLTAPAAHLSGTTTTPLLNGAALSAGTDPEKVGGGIEGASGKACLTVPEGAGNPPKVKGSAIYTLSIPRKGNYVIWARVWWLDSCANSVTVKVNKGKPCVLGQDSTYKSWHWVRVKRLTF
ncbi:MAG: hypothetical protein ACYTGH_09990, partial [Planctomycetota bacterium]